jgi:hypothetical protein
VYSGISLSLQERSVLTAHLHCVDDQKALVGLDRHHFEQHAVLVRAEEDDAIVLKRRVVRRRRADDRVGVLTT